MKIYLLSVWELQEGIAALGKCLAKLDSHRREMAARLKEPNAKNLSIGAGLLLQLIWSEWENNGGGQAVERVDADAGVQTEFFSVTQLLRRLDSDAFPEELAYVYSAKGKPQFADNLGGTIGSPCFNLAHSGEYVCCVAASEEVGIDIQVMRALTNFRVAERFFSENEKAALAACGDRRLREQVFYDIWVRKEAYAKLTGEGIGTGVAIDTMTDDRTMTETDTEITAETMADITPRLATGTAETTTQAKAVIWQNLQAPEGYRMAVCRYRTAYLK